MPESRCPTTREIADACGCSQSTVSNALRNDPRISAETRARIQEVAKGMGWKTNPLAAAFMAHLRSTKPPRYQANLAFAVSNPASPRVEDLPCNQQDLFHGARRRAEQLGFVLEPVWLHTSGLNAANLARMLKSRSIPGLILPGLLRPTDLFSTFDWDAIATVAVSHVLPEAPLHRVAFNYTKSVPMALRRLFELGYRRIAVIVSNAYDKKVNHGWLYPLYYEQQQPWGQQWIKSCIYSGSESSDRERVRAWIEQEQPDVILGEYLAWHVIREMDWKIPHDVAFATFDWSADHPDIGGIYQCHDVLGSMAAEMLISQVTQNERGLSPTPKLVVIEGNWRDGESVPLRDSSGLMESSRAS